MKTIDAAEAQAHLDEVLEEAQRQPVVIRRDDQDVVVVISIAEYRRFHAANVESFLQLRNDLAREAAANGLTEERLNALIVSDDI